MASCIRRLIRQHTPTARTLLELACGTGAILKILARYYDVVGLDLSPQMLSIARKKLPHVRLYRKDMVRFDLGTKFDVIICVFDSINHVLRFADWKKNIPQRRAAPSRRWIVYFRHQYRSEAGASHKHADVGEQIWSEL